MLPEKVHDLKKCACFKKFLIKINIQMWRRFLGKVEEQTSANFMITNRYHAFHASIFMDFDGRKVPKNTGVRTMGPRPPPNIL